MLISLNIFAITLHGRLWDGTASFPISNAYIFILSADQKEILAFAKTATQEDNLLKTGEWEVKGFEHFGDHVFVGFDPETKFNIAFEKKNINEDYDNNIVLTTNMLLDTPVSENQIHTDEQPFFTLVTAGWLTNEAYTASPRQASIKLADELLAGIDYNTENKVTYDFYLDSYENIDVSELMNYCFNNYNNKDKYSIYNDLYYYYDSKIIKKIGSNEYLFIFFKVTKSLQFLFRSLHYCDRSFCLAEFQKSNERYKLTNITYKIDNISSKGKFPDFELMNMDIDKIGFIFENGDQYFGHTNYYTTLLGKVENQYQVIFHDVSKASAISDNHKGEFNYISEISFNNSAIQRGYYNVELHLFGTKLIKQKESQYDEVVHYAFNGAKYGEVFREEYIIDAIDYLPLAKANYWEYIESTNLKLDRYNAKKSCSFKITDKFTDTVNYNGQKVIAEIYPFEDSSFFNFPLSDCFIYFDNKIFTGIIIKDSILVNKCFLSLIGNSCYNDSKCKRDIINKKKYVINDYNQSIKEYEEIRNYNMYDLITLSYKESGLQELIPFTGIKEYSVTLCKDIGIVDICNCTSVNPAGQRLFSTNLSSLSNISKLNKIIFHDDFNDNDCSINPTWEYNNFDDISGKISMVNGYVNFSRSNAEGNVGGVSLSYKFDYQIKRSTYIRFDVNTVYSDIENGAGLDDKEYPVNIILDLLDKNNNECILRFCYNYRGGSRLDEEKYKRIAFINVPRNEWLRDQTYNIKEYFPESSKLVNISIGANGWNFSGYIDNIEIGE